MELTGYAERFGSEIIVVNVHKPIPHLPQPRVEASETTFDVSIYEQRVVEEPGAMTAEAQAPQPVEEPAVEE